MKVRISCSLALPRWSRPAAGAVSTAAAVGSSSAASTRPRSSEQSNVHGLDRDRGAVHGSGGAALGLEQLHFAQLAVANDNAANGTNITLAQDDTQLTPAIAVDRRPVDRRLEHRRVVGPAGSQEVEAVGPIFGEGRVWRSSPARRRCRR